MPAAKEGRRAPGDTRSHASSARRAEAYRRETSRALRAITTSSLAWTTITAGPPVRRVDTRLASPGSSPVPELQAARVGGKIRTRTPAAPSPIPPVKTIASSPSSAVAAAAIPAAARSMNIRWRAQARRSPTRSLAWSSRMSSVPPTPRRPDSWSSARSISSGGTPERVSRKTMPGSSRASPRSHHQALERRHPHRGPDGSAPIDSGHRAASAQMGHDEAQIHRPVGRVPALPARGTNRPTAHGSRSAGRRTVPAIDPGPGTVAPRPEGSRGMPCRSLRHAGHRRVARGLPGSWRWRGVVERREVGDAVEDGEDVVIDPDRFRETVAAVHDPVADRMHGVGPDTLPPERGNHILDGLSDRFRRVTGPPLDRAIRTVARSTGGQGRSP